MSLLALDDDEGGFDGGNDDSFWCVVWGRASTFSIVCRGKEKPITTLLPHNSHEGRRKKMHGQIFSGIFLVDIGRFVLFVTSTSQGEKCIWFSKITHKNNCIAIYKKNGTSTNIVGKLKFR